MNGKNKMTTAVNDKKRIQNGIQFSKHGEKMTMNKLNQLKYDWLNGCA